MMLSAMTRYAVRRKLHSLRGSASRTAEEEVSLALRAAGASSEDVARYLAWGTMDRPLREACSTRQRRTCRTAA